MDSAAPSGLNVFRYGNARRRTIQAGATHSPVEASDQMGTHRQGRVADRTLRSSGTDEPCSLRT